MARIILNPRPQHVHAGSTERALCVCVCLWPRSSNQLLLCPHPGTRHMGCWDLLGVVVRLLLHTQSSTSSHFVTIVFQTVLQERFSLD